MASQPELDHSRRVFSGLSDSFYQMDTEPSTEEAIYVPEDVKKEKTTSDLKTIPPPQPKQQQPTVNHTRQIDHSTAPKPTVYCDVCIIS